MTKAALLLVPSILLVAGTASAPAGDVARGERAFQKCYACHSVRARETGLSGPNLRGILGRRIASERGFAYTPALRLLARRHRRWSPALLERFIADPEAVAPGNSMTFTGMPAARERADLIAYLRTRR